jgi:hypothetical protein
MYNDEVKSKIKAEFDKAEYSRSQGYEGRARVCARRAAGIAIRDYLRRNQLVSPEVSLNVNELLSYLIKQSIDLPEIQLIASHLMARVDEEFQLPPDIDLLADARWLVNKLENTLI